MVIFSTCFKADRFSQAEKEIEGGRKREGDRNRQREKEMKKKEKKNWPTHDRGPPQICVFQSVRCGQAVASSVCTQFHQEPCPGADGFDTLQNTKLDLSHCES